MKQTVAIDKFLTRFLPDKIILSDIATVLPHLSVSLSDGVLLMRICQETQSVVGLVFAAALLSMLQGDGAGYMFVRRKTSAETPAEYARHVTEWRKLKHARFQGSCDLSTLVHIVSCMYRECTADTSHSQTMLGWSNDNSMNNKSLHEARLRFHQLFRSLADLGFCNTITWEQAVAFVCDTESMQAWLTYIKPLLRLHWSNNAFVSLPPDRRGRVLYRRVPAADSEQYHTTTGQTQAIYETHQLNNRLSYFTTTPSNNTTKRKTWCYNKSQVVTAHGQRMLFLNYVFF
jgi:hypothetical protein